MSTIEDEASTIDITPLVRYSVTYTNLFCTFCADIFYYCLVYISVTDTIKPVTLINW